MALIQKALIIGGGVGGMCAAIQLRKLGIAVELVELNPAWAPDGAGITISGPSLRALREVGVVDEVLRLGGWWRAIDLRDAQGNLLRTVPIAPALGAEDLPSAAGIQRPVLAKILSAATRAAGATVRLGLNFESITQDSDGVDVLFSDGSGGRYDLVVGADGINSALRRLVFPDFAGPVFTGQGCWRAIVPRLHENSTMYLSDTIKAGINPISDDQCYLYLLYKRDGLDFIPPTAWPEIFADLMVPFTGELADIRRGLLDGSLPDPHLLYRPLAGHMIPAPWHRGRLVLLGDTVHATTPQLASGAGIAIEGALILAEELGRRHSLEGALTAYAGRHFDRANLVVQASATLGHIELSGGGPQAHAQVMHQTLELLRRPI
ncbi:MULTISPECIES: FAD-dependent oxidoreductase [Pseudomonas]|uniref:Monooxygenase n=3 Tax=Pseudomonas TaxID=286 RepID=C3K6P8_PSEFS|nr:MULTISPECIES: FAD-dependent oxidoreductase [Pseudomonas]MBZ6454897.1 FAD-dependent oxidoreductase [Pseudomonas fluorescens group sp.]MBZ6462085.1 FAD-dependent oxidoreductase [Pseudomonas fluorescens group sp.]MBZ6467387.1 FAD-dependent oxidoreductase [Pseudomonas fluorescens group sp.]QUE92622.1 FAD-dependent oxidoreductase [Pseudomonas sp. SCA2728.1_7]RMQ40384.1 putative monooxygenase [Pseudomonas cichorii]